MTMRKICILCCILVICSLVCFSVSADVAVPGVPYVPHFPGVTQSIWNSFLGKLQEYWGAIVAAVLAVAAFIAQIFHKK